MAMFRLILFAITFFVLALPVGARSERDADVPEGFYPIKGLQDYLEPFLVQGLQRYLATKDLIKIGEGSHGAAFWVEWPGFENGAVVKKTAEEEALHEATILAYVNGAGGAPRLVAFEASKGLIVMEYMGSTRLHDLFGKGLSKKQWMTIFMSMTLQVNRLHKIGIIHADIKSDNIHVSLNAKGHLTAHPIDFGLSTITGTPSSVVLRSADWKEEIKRYTQYGPEFFLGHALYPKSDVLGIADTMRTLMPHMETEASALYRLTERAYSYKLEDRPSMKEIYRALKWEYNHS